MTQVLSVSATTAGYVADTLKPPGKVAKPNYVEQIARQINPRVKELDKAESITRSAITSLRGSSAMGLHFMRTGESYEPRASLEEARKAYREMEELGQR